MKPISKTGFTLIELIVAMLIIGIIASFALLFFMTGAAGFMTAQQNAVLAQKARLVMARLSAEFSSEMKAIDSLSPAGIEKTYLKYRYRFDPAKDRQISLVGSGDRKKIVILDTKPDMPTATDEEVLIDDVSSFSMVFEKCDQTPWTTAEDMEALCRIEISLTIFVSSTGSDTVTFTTTIAPPDRDPIFGILGRDHGPFKTEDHHAIS